MCIWVTPQGWFFNSIAELKARDNLLKSGPAANSAQFGDHFCEFCRVLLTKLQEALTQVVPADKIKIQ